MKIDRRYIQPGPEVEQALLANQPVVALESTLITHGLPYPLNLQTAQEMEQEVRNAGATPATICLLDGMIRVGLNDDELSRLAEPGDTVKISSRGIGWALPTKQTAGTTVSGTMWIAAKVGIELFGTGGTGGVHVGASETGDISTDLFELARTPVAVVSSGVKSILDIGRTLEYLESVGVPVFGFQTDQFPAFFSGTSGHSAPMRLENAADAARTWQVHRDLGINTGMLIACPPPITLDDAGMLQQAVDQANREARESGISSGAVTPFVLGRIAELTDGESLRINTALLRHNAGVAGSIASALHTIRNQ
ncbi:MAG: pseudouridine-5'-phosphate glycosidase [Sphaerobacteraceae bacterium]|nr:MAG: pseudouridine-5'-phosphate glycosidase [Sphaerobacteraceae bacterium]